MFSCLCKRLECLFDAFRHRPLAIGVISNINPMVMEAIIMVSSNNLMDILPTLHMV